jgi:hypothetical protein
MSSCARDSRHEDRFGASPCCDAVFIRGSDRWSSHAVPDTIGRRLDRVSACAYIDGHERFRTR